MRKKINIKKVLSVLALVYVAYVLISTQITTYRIKAQIKVKQDELNTLKEKNQKLQDEIKQSKTDSYIEKLARERLGLIKEGETPVINNNKK